MPRPGVSTAMIAALSAGEVSPAFFVEMNFSTGPVYLWTGFGSISWNGQTWLGAGQMGSISVIDEGSAVEAKGMSLGLSGFDPTLLPLALADLQLGLPATVYLGAFNGTSLIATPITSWSGRMDKPTVDVAGATGKIEINFESRVLDLNASCGRRYTPEDQQRNWPGDLGFIFVAQIQQITLYWGQAPISSGTI